jgi:uncharacterized protein (UPF0333 family)
MSIKKLIDRLQLRRKTLVLLAILVITVGGSYLLVFQYKTLKSTGSDAAATTPAKTDASASAASSVKDETPTVIVEPTPLPTQAELDAIDISSWKIYQNSRYGFEISYPSDWNVVARGDTQVHFLAADKPVFSGEQPGEGTVSIVMEDGADSNQYLVPQYTSTGTAKIGGKDAEIYSGVPGGQDAKAPTGVYTIAILKDGKKVLLFNYLDEIADKEDGKYLAYYQKMLSTFRFLK